MSLIVTPGVEFSANSFVHTKLTDDAPLHANSAGLAADFLRQKKAFYGTVNTNTYQYTPPIYIVDSSIPTVKIKPVRANDATFQSWGPPMLGPALSAVPLPSDFAPSVGTDMEAVIYRPETYEYWEVWVCKKTGSKTVNSAGQTVDEWQAAWGGHIQDIRKNPGWFSDGMGTQACGIPFLATIMTIAEQQSGIIKHPLQLAMPEIGKGVCAPARRTDGWRYGPNYPIMGSRWRFPANIDFAPYGMNKYATMVATAIRDYGMILSDTAGAIVLRTENPMTYPVNPYGEVGGIWGAPAPYTVWDTKLSPYNCFERIPWSKLQVLAP